MRTNVNKRNWMIILIVLMDICLLGAIATMSGDIATRFSIGAAIFGAHAFLLSFPEI